MSVAPSDRSVNATFSGLAPIDGNISNSETGLGWMAKVFIALAETIVGSRNGN
jgi:hypothetical protein